MVLLWDTVWLYVTRETLDGVAVGHSVWLYVTRETLDGVAVGHSVWLYVSGKH